MTPDVTKRSPRAKKHKNVGAVFSSRHMAHHRHILCALQCLRNVQNDSVLVTARTSGRAQVLRAGFLVVRLRLPRSCVRFSSRSRFCLLVFWLAASCLLFRALTGTSCLLKETNTGELSPTFNLQPLALTTKVPKALGGSKAAPPKTSSSRHLCGKALASVAAALYLATLVVALAADVSNAPSLHCVSSHTVWFARSTVKSTLNFPWERVVRRGAVARVSSLSDDTYVLWA